jgi:hypothetical protein
MVQRVDLPNEVAIIDAISRLTYTTSSRESVHSFLLDFTPAKSPTDRLLSWLITLGLLRPLPFTWAKNLSEMAKSYFLTEVVSTGEWDVPPPVAAGLQESASWFPSLFYAVTDVRSLRAVHVPRLCAVIRTHGNAAAAADGARVVFISAVCFSVAVQFTTAARFSDDFAEGIAFYLARAIVGATQSLPSLDPARREAYFARLSSNLFAVAEMNWRWLQVGKVTFDFAAVYHGALFARQMTKLDDVLRLWDQLLAKLPILADLVTAVTMSAVQNLEITEKCMDIRALVLSQRDWNVLKIVDDAIRILEHKRSLTERVCAAACRCFPGLKGWDVRS